MKSANRILGRIIALFFVVVGAALPIGCEGKEDPGKNLIRGGASRQFGPGETAD